MPFPSSLWRRKWQPTPVFLRGESQGQRNLVGCHLWGRIESDTTELQAAGYIRMVDFLNCLVPTSQVTQGIKKKKHLPVQEIWVLSRGWKDPLEKEMATHSSILAWEIPWTKEPGRLQSMGSQRVGHNSAPKHHHDSC